MELRPWRPTKNLKLLITGIIWLMAQVSGLDSPLSFATIWLLHLLQKHTPKITRMWEAFVTGKSFSSTTQEFIRNLERVYSMSHKTHTEIYLHCLFYVLFKFCLRQCLFTGLDPTEKFKGVDGMGCFWLSLSPQHPAVCSENPLHRPRQPCIQNAQHNEAMRGGAGKNSRFLCWSVALIERRPGGYFTNSPKSFLHSVLSGILFWIPSLSTKKIFRTHSRVMERFTFTNHSWKLNYEIQISSSPKRSGSRNTAKIN